MNSDLEQFSENMLEKMAVGDIFATTLEQAALARIALSVKQANPVCYADQSDIERIKSGSTTRIGSYQTNVMSIALYTTPQPAHTEQVVPDGWKLVPIEPTDEQLRLMLAARYPATFREYLRNPLNGHKSRVEAEILIVEVTNQYKNALAAAPKPESE